jgi:acyl-CoA dehydrogenase
LAGSAGTAGALPAAVARGEAIAAFALSEPDAGSDVGAMALSAAPQDGEHNVHAMDGSKTWICNGGIADFYCVFASTGERPVAPRHQRFRGRCQHARLDSVRAHRA